MTFLLFVSHLVGDYFFQTDWMAINKTRMDPKGWLACLVHSIVYSLTIVLVMMWGRTVSAIGYAFLMVFLTHFPIDKFSLGKYLLKLKGNDITRTDALFWIVYIAVDNTSHLILMALGFHYLFGVNFG